MIYSIADPKIQQFLEANLNADTSELLLKYREVNGIPTPFIVDQIKGRIKAKGRFARLLEDPLLIYPPSVNLEQSSSQATAEFKRDFLRTLIGSHSEMRHGADLTGGFGVDALFLSEIFNTYDFVEQDSSLFEIARHNLSRLQPKLNFYNATAEQYLQRNPQPATLMYIDPSRRDNNSQKVVRLQDSCPDVVHLQDAIFERAEWLVVKTSPLLDIDLAASQLKFVRAVFVISVSNEAREVVFVCQKNFVGSFSIHAADIRPDKNHVLEFSRLEEERAPVKFADVSSFLYEPNASIRKAGAFRTIASKYALEKIHPNTHLYTSDKLLPDFPGRVFRVVSKVKSDAKKIGALVNGQANVMTRNYPLKPEELKKKMKLKDGGEKFLIGFTGEQGPQLVVAERANVTDAE